MRGTSKNKGIKRVKNNFCKNVTWSAVPSERLCLTSFLTVEFKVNLMVSGQRPHRHRCTAVGEGNTSPTTKLYEFYHLLLTARIFSPCLMHGRIQIVLKTVQMKYKVMANDHRR